jgi:LPXTG-motif cell wall-anchored protein
MLAMVLLVAAPALAQNATQTSGPASSNLAVDAAGAGNVCVQQANNVNTGNNQQNLANIQANIQANLNLLAGEMNRIMETGPGDLNAASNNAATQTNNATNTQNGITQLNAARQQCEQALAIVQGAAGKAEATAGKAEAKAEAGKAEAKGGEAKAGGAEAKAGEAPKAEAKAQTLPATGGSAAPFALGAGALLVAGGLLARRMIK